ncbi:conserved Plasmodium protein, unknown function [Plasmodium berghei]|uniref:Uncharacterized protein n=2 Tax=Plasmodium berghei TaxID=5821 RepID=A0A509AMH9_PLABA|nr:conserved Plasmodium protein, unknown function [Plasmodium berghei ANKA]CXI64913.1 conserved Plasmodium protein, unknown function [Plasmodium berghei]SCM23909.1 conserved Plasmodium protein, unknown function [Plasmodium berghei]SCN26833.1 conserved Plasmodium protein, unknown function [Plasmodium berghei]SCO61207.1 conserved Plasmodium protein, unknown function [Plasmodium berghei]SCO63253.1 conserved Plasmodium protein, unknown function [Plasmodium berghei]|eukprot:XP_034422450.1 conserved Plasmodium protein, unknown function [Plasmodium berghei ANKA]
MNVVISLIFLSSILLNKNIIGRNPTRKVNDENDRCKYMNIFEKHIFYECYLFTNNENGCCKIYIKERQEKKKKNELLSLHDILKDSADEYDIDEVKHFFPVFSEKLFHSSNGNKGKGMINSDGDLLIEFNNKYFNLKDIKVNVITNKKRKKNIDNYANFVKKESDYIKKKNELFENSPFYTTNTCFKYIGGGKCKNQKKSKNQNEDNDEYPDEELDYELSKSLNGDIDVLNSNDKSSKNDLDPLKYIFENSNINEDIVDTDNNKNKTIFSRIYNFFNNFSLINSLARSPKKLMQKNIEFKGHLNNIDALEKYLDNEYIDTTEQINTIITNDLQKAFNTDNKEENINKKKGLISSMLSNMFSLIYLPRANVEL